MKTYYFYYEGYRRVLGVSLDVKNLSPYKFHAAANHTNRFLFVSKNYNIKVLNKVESTTLNRPLIELLIRKLKR